MNSVGKFTFDRYAQKDPALHDLNQALWQTGAEFYTRATLDGVLQSNPDQAELWNSQFRHVMRSTTWEDLKPKLLLGTAGATIVAAEILLLVNAPVLGGLALGYLASKASGSPYSG